MEIIVAEGERLTTLINNVLDLAKIEAGKFEWVMEPLSVDTIVDRGVAATAGLFEEKGLDLTHDVADDLPLVVGDRDSLIQVVINLLSNAVKFTDTGGVTCRARLLGDEVVISVSDTGVGIAEADQPRVFEQFAQVGDTLTGKPLGTGLGLPICKQIVERHGGRLWLDSTVGAGSTFSFTLPVRCRRQRPPATPATSLPTQRHRPPRSGRPDDRPQRRSAAAGASRVMRASAEPAASLRSVISSRQRPSSSGPIRQSSRMSSRPWTSRSRTSSSRGRGRPGRRGGRGAREPGRSSSSSGITPRRSTRPACRHQT